MAWKVRRACGEMRHGVEHAECECRSSSAGCRGLQVISADLGQPFPKKKERKNSAAEGYVPPGILQSYWLTKHTCQLPAVMAVLFQWDDEVLTHTSFSLVASLDEC